MKNYNVIIAIALQLLVASSCEKAVVDEPIDDTTYTVNLFPKEENISITEIPLSRAGDDKKIYAINVSEKKPRGTKVVKYAYGLFSDPERIALKLKKGYHYSIECLIVKDDIESLYNDNGEYLAPFYHGVEKKDTLPTKLTNQFVYSSKNNLFALTSGYTHISATKKVSHPRLYKFYGKVENFTPSSDDESITIDMKRCVFGLHFLITPPEEGEYTISYLNRTINLKAGSPAYDEQSIFSFKLPDKCIAPQYSSLMELSLKWTHSDGTFTTETKDITLRRNFIQVIKIEGNKGAKGSKISLNEESGALSKDTILWHFSG